MIVICAFFRGVIEQQQEREYNKLPVIRTFTHYRNSIRSLFIPSSGAFDSQESAVSWKKQNKTINMKSWFMCVIVQVRRYKHDTT